MSELARLWEVAAMLGVNLCIEGCERSCMWSLVRDWVGPFGSVRSTVLKHHRRRYRSAAAERGIDRALCRAGRLMGYQPPAVSP